jgi:hypothetical protein
MRNFDYYDDGLDMPYMAQPDEATVFLQSMITNIDQLLTPHNPTQIKIFFNHFYTFCINYPYRGVEVSVLYK